MRKPVNPITSALVRVTSASAPFIDQSFSSTRIRAALKKGLANYSGFWDRVHDVKSLRAEGDLVAWIEVPSDASARGPDSTLESFSVDIMMPVASMMAALKASRAATEIEIAFHSGSLFLSFQYTPDVNSSADEVGERFFGGYREKEFSEYEEWVNVAKSSYPHARHNKRGLPGYTQGYGNEDDEEFVVGPDMQADVVAVWNSEDKFGLVFFDINEQTSTK